MGSNAAAVARWRAKNRDWVHQYGAAWRLKRRYGITPADRLALFEASDGLCAACYEEPATELDHNHETGEIRGALCRGCNVALGMVREDLGRISRLAEYLEGGPMAMNSTQ